jgi:hypothetical protein
MPQEQQNLLAPVREGFLRQLQVALAGIDSETDPHRRVRIDVSRRQLGRLEAEKRLRLRIRAHKTVISRAAYAPLWLLRRLRDK